MLHIRAQRGMLVADTTYEMELEFGTLEDRGSTVALFRAGGYVGTTYMQMKLHRITALILPAIKERVC